ncbi:hypothetical protein C8J57DRAFT_1501413 [Mycena rebaudengoi]|nr:hypothetical protein C8J57DRAFT_1501413 [Mycena rebaudengoi]
MSSMRVAHVLAALHLLFLDPCLSSLRTEPVFYPPAFANCYAGATAESFVLQRAYIRYSLSSLVPSSSLLKPLPMLALPTPSIRSWRKGGRPKSDSCPLFIPLAPHLPPFPSLAFAFFVPHIIMFVSFSPFATSHRRIYASTLVGRGLALPHPRYVSSRGDKVVDWDLRERLHSASLFDLPAIQSRPDTEQIIQDMKAMDVATLTNPMSSQPQSKDHQDENSCECSADEAEPPQSEMQERRWSRHVPPAHIPIKARG